MALGVTLLGGFQIQLVPGGVLSLPMRKAQALLAYLAPPPGRAHPRDKLAALLWGESSDAKARDGLRHALAALRQALPNTVPPILLVEGLSRPVGEGGIYFRRSEDAGNVRITARGGSTSPRGGVAFHRPAGASTRRWCRPVVPLRRGVMRRRAPTPSYSPSSGAP